jgi:signal peptidase
MNIADGVPKQELTLDVLRRHGRCRLRVSGTSMLPTLWPGDTVLIETRPLSHMSVGDIVLYQRCGRLFLHRLIALPEEKFPGRIVTRGDSVPQADPAVRVEGVLGVLAGVRRGQDWVAVPRCRTPASRLAATLLARSSALVRLLLRIRFSPETFSGAPSLSRFFLGDRAGLELAKRAGGPSRVDGSPEVPAS